MKADLPWSEVCGRSLSEKNQASLGDSCNIGRGALTSIASRVYRVCGIMQGAFPETGLHSGSIEVWDNSSRSLVSAVLTARRTDFDDRATQGGSPGD